MRDENPIESNPHGPALRHLKWPVRFMQYNFHLWPNRLNSRVESTDCTLPVGSEMTQPSFATDVLLDANTIRYVDMIRYDTTWPWSNTSTKGCHVMILMSLKSFQVLQISFPPIELASSFETQCSYAGYSNAKHVFDLHLYRKVTLTESWNEIEQKPTDDKFCNLQRN